jgi:putative ABC transport system permease protein
MVQECFAVMGIAAGVALLFASQVANTSLQSSVSALSQGIVGRATLQLAARDPHGFPQGTLARVRAIAGVRAAAPLLEADANAIGPQGSESVKLIGADASLSALGGRLVHDTELTPFGSIGAVVLPVPLARAVGVTRFGQEVMLQLAGHTTQVPLYAQLHEKQIGRLIGSPVAIAPLSFVQEATGLRARVSRILVQPAAGSQAQVRRALQGLAAGRLDVEPVSHDAALFAQAAAANNRSTAVFSVISALVGFLFAFNAMLLTVPQRRTLISALRRDGYTPATVIVQLLLDAVALGIVACALGLVLGEELSIHVLHSNPAFLSLAFALGSERVITLQTVMIAVGGGMLAAIVAVLSPLRDIRSRDPLAATGPRKYRNAAFGASRHPLSPVGRAVREFEGARGAVGAVACLVGATALLLARPEAAIGGMILLMGALLLVLPLALSATLALVRGVAARITSATPHVAAMELGAARARAMAIAATGAMAVFGSVAIEGAHDDLLAGLERAAGDTNAAADIWVAPAGAYNLLQTTPFTPDEQARLEALPGVRAVGLYRSGLLDWGGRRLWVGARPRAANPIIPVADLMQGNAKQVNERVRVGGWLVLSRAVAEEHDLHIGEAFTLPTPAPETFRLAGLSTNLGWAPGVVIMNASDYARAWHSRDIGAYAITLTPGFGVTRAVRELEHTLGRHSGLAVQSAAGHAERQRALSRAALARLSEIARLILVVAALAVAAAMGALLWQRRPRLANLKLEGFPRVQLWRIALLESGLLLAVGCVSGAVLGLYGQQLADRALAGAVNFPVVYSVGAGGALESVALVYVAALAMVAIPGYVAAGAAASLALAE